MAEDKPDLKKELNSLWKLAVDQLDEIKDVIVQGTEVGRQKLDTVLLRQNREKVCAELGRLVHEQGDRADYPEAWLKLLKRIDEIDEDIASRAPAEQPPAAPDPAIEPEPAPPKVTKDDLDPVDEPPAEPD